MEARQERIAELVRKLLPCVEQCRRKERLFNGIIVFVLITYMMLGGYIAQELNRPIDSNEFIILSSIISLQAQANNEKIHSLTDKLLSRFHIQNLQDIKARDWSDALKYLATHQEH